MTDGSTRLRRVVSVPAFVIGMLLLAACSDDAPAPAASENEPEVTSTSTTTTAAVEEPEPTVPEASPQEALAAAIAAIGTAYEFDSTATTAAGDLVDVTGYRLDTSSSYTIDVGGAVVDVIVVDGEAWVRAEGNDEWLPSGDNPDGDPLASLSAPLSVVRDDADPDVLVATYDGAAIGFDATGPVEVRISATDGQITFESASGGTSLVTTLTRNDDLAPITTPAN